MKYLLRFLLVLSIPLFVLSCRGQEGTSVVILSCVDTEGNELSGPVTITVDGITQTWIPGAPLVFDLDFDVDLGYVDVRGSAANYRQISPVTYEIERALGLELVLSFTDTDVLEPLTVRMEFNLSPEEATVELRSRSENTTIRFSGSQSINLPEDLYEWRASFTGFNSDSGTLMVREDGDQRVNISLSRETVVSPPPIVEPEPEDGYLTMLILPQSTIRLSHQTNGNVYTFNPIGLTQENLPPGSYSYRITAPGFIPEEGTVEIRELQTSSIELELINESAASAVRDATQIQNVNQAVPFAISFLQNPQQLNSLSPNEREEFAENLARISMILFGGGERTRAEELMEAIHNQMPENITIRMQYGEILSQQGQFARSREMFRGVFGQYVNRIPVQAREQVTWLARFRLARTYYREFLSLNEFDFDERAEVGDAAISALSDVMTRFENSPNLSAEANRYRDAEVMHNSIIRDLGY